MGAKVIIFGKLLNSNFVKGLVHSALSCIGPFSSLCCWRAAIRHRVSSSPQLLLSTSSHTLEKVTYYLTPRSFWFHFSKNVPCCIFCFTFPLTSSLLIIWETSPSKEAILSSDLQAASSSQFNIWPTWISCCLVGESAEKEDTSDADLNIQLWTLILPQNRVLEIDMHSYPEDKNACNL